MAILETARMQGEAAPRKHQCPGLEENQCLGEIHRMSPSSGTDSLFPLSPPKVPDYSIESGFLEAGKTAIAGVDEAGRGPLAGPVVAAAVILDRNNLPEGLNDSKKLTGKRREELFSRNPQVIACRLDKPAAK